MLANPRHSRIVLINPSREGPATASDGFIVRRRESLSLLPAASDIFGVSVHMFGEHYRGVEPQNLTETISVLDGNGPSLWNDRKFIADLAESSVGVVFLGGAWLEEDVFVAVLEGVRLGYDVRVLADMSMSRVEADRALVLNRFGMHGVVITTVRQMLLEWAVSLDDHGLRQRVTQLLR
jgi:nicotinamidase-related amidase